MAKAGGAETSDVFRAVSDPTRRGILDLLAGGDRAVRDLMQPFDVSQPAISQHLRVLREAGLVSERRQGRLRIYRLNPQPIRKVHQWAAHYERFWKRKLDALGKYLERVHGNPAEKN
jgi:DNA-binding transcriptional ArsR family regulator